MKNSLLPQDGMHPHAVTGAFKHTVMLRRVNQSVSPAFMMANIGRNNLEKLQEVLIWHLCQHPFLNVYNDVNYTDAEDAVLEAFRKASAWKKRIKSRAFVSWMKKVSFRFYMNSRRKKFQQMEYTNKRLDDSNMCRNCTDHVLFEDICELDDWFDSFLSILPLHLEVVMKKYCREQLSVKQIASELEMSKMAIYKRLWMISKKYRHYYESAFC